MVVSKSGKVWKYDFRYNDKRYRKTGFKTKKAATIAENEKLTEVSKCENLSNKTLFSEYFLTWLKVNKAGKISDSSYQRYITSLSAFTEYFGEIPISKVTQLGYRDFLKNYGEGKFLKGAKHGRTSESVKKLHSCLKGAFEDAHESGIILRNPTFKANPTGVKKPQNEDEKFMSQSTFESIVDFSKEGTELSHLVLYMLCVTGARFSEIAKMQYSDLQYPNNLIHIPGTKTINADRTIPISKEAKQHILNEVNKRPRNLNNYIFFTGVSTISNNAVTKVFQKHLLKNNLGYYTLHALRHTHASLLLKEGFPIQYISKRLGHSDIQVTLRTYSHLLNEQEKEEDEKLVEFLAKY